MKDFHLRFVDDKWPDSAIMDLLATDPDDIPSGSGAYVLGTGGETLLTYP